MFELIKTIVSTTARIIEELRIDISIEIEEFNIRQYNFQVLKNLVESTSFNSSSGLDIVLRESYVMNNTGDYVLLDVSPMTDVGRRRILYLLMKCPSTGLYHLQGVPSYCRNVQEALNWRNTGEVNEKWIPIKLT